MKTCLNQTWIVAVALGLLCALPASGQKKEVLAIGKVETTKALAEDMQRKGKTVEMRRVIEAMDGHLISALAQTRKFTLVGRSDLADLLKEQDLGDSGVIDAGTAAEKGKVKGAKFRLVTTVDSFLEENVETVFAGTGRKNLAFVQKQNMTENGRDFFDVVGNQNQGRPLFLFAQTIEEP